MRIVKHGFLLMLLLWGTVEMGYGQNFTAKKRTYANFQVPNTWGLLLNGTVTDGGNAIDGNFNTASTLRVPLGALGLMGASQYLEFTTNGQHSGRRLINAGMPVTVKFSLPSEVLGLLSGVSIGTFTNLSLSGSNYSSSSNTSYLTAASLLNLLNGSGEFEVTFIPTSAYNGVYLTLSSVLGVGLTANLFHAYIMDDAEVSCSEADMPIDVLSGVRAGAVALANATGSVTNPWGMVDGSGPTTLNLGAQVLSEVFHTTIFNTPSRPHQVVKVLFQNPGGGLLDLGLLTGLKIQPYLGNTAVGLPLNESTLLSLRLLPGSSDIAELTVPVAGSFDRIEISMGGVLGALASLTLHEVSRTFGPLIYPEAELLDKLTECEEVDLKDAILNYDPVAYSYNYYTTSAGGTPQGSVVTESGTYYIEVTENVTGCVSERVEVVANVLPLPGNPNLTISETIN